MERNRNIVVVGLGAAMFVGISGGCEGPPAAPVEIDSINHDLVIGSTGPEVQALTDYLTTYGYFPSADLQHRFPAWRPIVASAPSRGDVFDLNDQKALLAFQANSGLPQTGVLDAGTRALMTMPRCGVPDGMQRLDPSDKWASENTTEGWTQTVNWYLQNNTSGLSTSSVVSDIQSMLNGWNAWSAYKFAQSSTNAEIIVNFANLGNVSTIAETGSEDCVVGVCGGGTPGVPAPSYVTVNSFYSWSDNGSPGSSQYDLPTVLLHELGHALGLAHSSYPNAIMYPVLGTGTVKRSLAADDVEGIATTNPVYTNVGAPPGGLVVRAVQNNHFNGPSIWALAGNAPGGSNIWELDGSWVQHPGGAVRIAINTSGNANRPWVINNQNQLFRWNWGSNNWDNIPACATDIGIGTDDSVWVIGCNAVDSNGDLGIYKYNGDTACASGNCWSGSDGGAIQISVGARSPTDPTIVPWLINKSYQVFRRTSSDPTVSGAWEQLPSLPINTMGIAAGNSGYSYAINLEGSGYPTVFSWDEQPAFNGGSPGAPAERGWFNMGLGTTSPHPSAIAPAGLFPIMVAGQTIYTVQ